MERGAHSRPGRHDRAGRPASHVTAGLALGPAPSLESPQTLAETERNPHRADARALGLESLSDGRVPRDRAHHPLAQAEGVRDRQVAASEGDNACALPKQFKTKPERPILEHALARTSQALLFRLRDWHDVKPPDVFQDGTLRFRFELLWKGACVVAFRSGYLSIPYSFSLRQRVVRPIPRDSAVRE